MKRKQPQRRARLKRHLQTAGSSAFRGLRVLRLPLLPEGLARRVVACGFGNDRSGLFLGMRTPDFL